MRSISCCFWLLHFLCVVISTELCAVGENVVMHKCLNKPPHHLPRLDEISVSDLVALQSSGSVSSIDLVHVRLFYPPFFENRNLT